MEVNSSKNIYLTLFNPWAEPIPPIIHSPFTCIVVPRAIDIAPTESGEVQRFDKRLFDGGVAG